MRVTQAEGNSVIHKYDWLNNKVGEYDGLQHHTVCEYNIRKGALRSLPGGAFGFPRAAQRPLYMPVRQAGLPCAPGRYILRRRTKSPRTPFARIKEPRCYPST